MMMSPVTSRQKLLLHYTLLHLDSEQMGKIFYDHVLSAMPDVHPMFGDVDAQRKRFMKMMVRIVHTVDEPEQLRIVVRELRDMHAHYHLKPRQFQTMGQAFSMSLVEVMGHRYTPEIGEAWQVLYRRVAEAMQEGGSNAGSSYGSHAMHV
ncbi:MAG: hypothetical protein KC615_09395 [Anaerolineae bacterium]|nr:hypothetical protein [Anaerolineae bacterium]MCA9893187.1 hypothetical protein [Anaerolineae bacterium]MCB9460825.1 hypothetical protein [Anaerolineaceae bacterium]